jgi:hypothetical protein
MAPYSICAILAAGSQAAADLSVEPGDLGSGRIGRSIPALIEKGSARRIIQIHPPGPGRERGIVLFGEGESELSPGSLRGPR